MANQDSSTPLSHIQHQIAPLSDRFLSFVFDAVFFAPLFSFILASLFRKLELMRFVSPDSTEYYTLFSVSVVFVSLLAILFQTLFLVLMGATPGQAFFKLHVVNFQSQSPLRFSQALLRSFLWVCEIFFLGVPFLEVLSDPQRRPLHDRAAGTMVATLKEKGDRGPQILETHFVRQVLLLISLTTFAWVIFFTGQFYKMAVRGEFKKNELEKSGYLCSSVSSAMEDGDDRMDKALALYLADEVSENCLASEADFVLWSHDDEEKAWAYLAKGILKKYDSEQFEAYLNKACDSDAEGTACLLAKKEARQSDEAWPADSQTSLVLQIQEEFENGRYAQAEKKLTLLSEESGFDDFVQSSLIKTYWSLNKKEQARGAYQVVAKQMQRSSGSELAAWMCHEEIDFSCSNEPVASCEDVKELTVRAGRPIPDATTALALVRDHQCRPSEKLNLERLMTQFKDKRDLVDFLNALLLSEKQDVKSQTASLLILKELALRKESVRPSVVRRLAFMKWAESSRDASDMNEIATFLKSRKVRDMTWIKIYRRALESSLQINSVQAAQAIVGLATSEDIRTHQLQDLQIQGEYLAQNYENAWKGLQNLRSSARAPASMGRWDVREIQKVLEPRFGSGKGKAP